MATVVNADGLNLPMGGATTTAFIGTSASETYFGTSGNDAFRANGGGDMLFGGLGDDFYNIYDVNDKIFENPNAGTDTVLATVNYILPSNIENLQQYSNAYGIGNGLDNVIDGQGAGAQWLDGAGGNDVISGGAGNDTFSIRAGGGHDLVRDFTVGSDRAQLAVGGFTSFDQVKAAMIQVGSSVVLALGAGGEQLWFGNHQISDFSGRDFMLPVDRSRLNLTFADEFDTLSLYNMTTKTGTWWTTFGTGGPLQNRTLSRNGEKQFYVEPGYTGSGSTDLGINPFAVHDGVVDITATLNTSAQQSALYGYQYSSGMLATKTTFSQQYGYFEVSAKLPTGKGFWPGFWLLPTDYTYTPEIDIFEAHGDKSGTTFQTLHPTGSAATTKIAYTADPDQFHTYGLLWDRNYLVWYVDGVETNRMATPPEANKPMFLVLTLPIGGYWSGNPDPNTFQPSSFTIDYVHAYTLSNAAPVAAGETYGGAEDAPFVITQSAGVLANDSDPNASDASWLTAVLLTAPAHGGVALNKDGSFNYTPTANFNGSDSFTYAAFDGLAQSAPVTVNLVVSPVNDAPSVSAPTLLAATEQTPLDLKATPIVILDVDGGGSPLTLVISAGEGSLVATSGSSGVAIAGSGSNVLSLTGSLAQLNAMLQSDPLSTLAYTDNTDTPSALTTLSIVATDSGGLSGATSTTVAITSVNDAPIAGDDAVQVLQGHSLALNAANLLANDYDPEGGALTIGSVGNAMNGSVSLAKAVITFTPATGYAGAASFTYEVNDGALSATAAVNITVVSSAPTYTNGTANGDVYDFSSKLNTRLVNGQGGNDLIIGGSNADSLNGGAGDDTIYGGAGADMLTGGAGSDTLTGGSGADKFVFAAAADFGLAGQVDVITDFARAEGDKVILTGVDANLNLAGDQAFTFLGTSAFSQSAGQVRYDANNGNVTVYGDTNGDGVADFQFQLLGVTTLGAVDFSL